MIGVARFSEPGLRETLTAAGVECIAADLLDRGQIEALPKSPNVVFMAGRKFGAVRSRRPDLGDERPRAGAGGGGVRGLAHRRLLDRLRLPFVNVLHGGATEDDARHAAARRLCEFLRRP